MEKKGNLFLTAFSTFFLILMLGFSVFAGTPSLNKSSASIKVGKSVELTVKGVNGKKVKWKSSDSSIAKVSKKGVVTGMQEGKVNIYALVGENELKCKIKVKPVTVRAIRLNQKSLNLTIGETYKLKASVYPKKAKNKEIKWSSNHSKIVKVDESGNLTACKVGSATIKATAKDGSKKYASCIIHVKLPKAKKITISSMPDFLCIGESVKLSCLIEPENASSKVTWKSSNPEVITVNNKGEIEGVSAGTAKIKVTTTDGSKKTSTVNVTVENINYSYIRRLPQEEQINFRKIMAMKKQYPEGMEYGNTKDTRYVFHGGHYYAGYGCASFAFKISDRLFGDKPAEKYVVDGYNISYSIENMFSRMKVGDILRFDSDAEYGHCVVVLGKNSNEVIVCEANHGGKIHWFRRIKKENLIKQNLYWMLTRY